jgi:hypothetical protein
MNELTIMVPPDVVHMKKHLKRKYVERSSSGRGTNVYCIIWYAVVNLSLGCLLVCHAHFPPKSDVFISWHYGVFVIELDYNNVFFWWK